MRTNCIWWHGYFADGTIQIHSESLFLQVLMPRALSTYFCSDDCRLVFISSVSDISPLFSIRGTFIISIQGHLPSPASVFLQTLQPSGRKTATLDQKSNSQQTPCMMFHPFTPP